MGHSEHATAPTPLSIIKVDEKVLRSTDKVGVVVERGESEPIATTAVDDDTATEQGVEATKTGNDNEAAVATGNVDATEEGVEVTNTDTGNDNEAAVATGNTDCPVEKEDNSATKTIVGTKLESMAENEVELEEEAPVVGPTMLFLGTSGGLLADGTGVAVPMKLVFLHWARQGLPPSRWAEGWQWRLQGLPPSRWAEGWQWRLQGLPRQDFFRARASTQGRHWAHLQARASTQG
eukprot:CAMPEP_0169436608 /NCGR_PEP_ID=MMETSP1042-20121227/5685_1 /TAXON_ID=464988 /ORGANISM="Hemiselmis andersenii, Strain CCMP1180" /LENGTH=234 /DNA_ID=CAMNT_0009547325 /DNA_START=420 /DNA_END=1127 /DNA_ORIENTATION=+